MQEHLSNSHVVAVLLAVAFIEAIRQWRKLNVRYADKKPLRQTIVVGRQPPQPMLTLEKEPEMAPTPVEALAMQAGSMPFHELMAKEPSRPLELFQLEKGGMLMLGTTDSVELLDKQVFRRPVEPRPIEEDVDFSALTLHRLSAEIQAKLDTMRDWKLA